MVIAVAFVLLGLIAIFPVQAALNQKRHRAELVVELAELTAETTKLEAQATRLRSDAEIERLARLNHQLVKPGEEAYAIVAEQSSAAGRNPVPSR